MNLDIAALDSFSFFFSFFLRAAHLIFHDFSNDPQVIPLDYTWNLLSAANACAVPLRVPPEILQKCITCKGTLFQMSSDLCW